jgi:hypothetical protein
MALAIAAPALAATGWDALPEEEDTYVDFEMLAAKYEYYSSTSGGYGANGTYYANWDDNKGVVKDTLGRAYFEASTPSAADVLALYPGVDFTNLKAKVTITNVKGVASVNLAASPVNFVPALDIAGIDNKNVFTATFPLALDTDYEYMYVFAAASAADVVATITITAGDTTLPATFLYKGVTLTADATTDNGCE